MNKALISIVLFFLLIACSREPLTTAPETRAQPITSLSQIIAQQDAYLGQTVTVTGTIAGHFEGGSASGIWGETLTITDSGAELYLKTNGNWISYGTGPQGNPPGSEPSPAQYRNNVVGNLPITKGNTYRFTGTIETDQYNPGRTVLHATSAQQVQQQ